MAHNLGVAMAKVLKNKVTHSFADLDQARLLISSSSAPKVLTSSPGGAKRTGQKKSGPSQNVPPPSTGFQGSNQKPAPHFQSPSSPKFQSPKAPAHGVQSTGPGSHIGSPHQHQGPRIAPYQTAQWQPGFPQRSPTGGGEQSSPQRSRGGGEGSPKSRPFIPLQPR